MLRPVHFLVFATLSSSSFSAGSHAAALVAEPLLPTPEPVRLPRVAPESVGMSATRLAMIDDVVLAGIRAGGFPGAAVIVARRGDIVWERGYGTLDWRSGVAVDA